MEPRKRKLSWEVKDACRGVWYIHATPKGVLPSAAEEGFHVTVWRVEVETRQAQPGWNLRFDASTQFDEPIKLVDIWREVQSQMNLFTEAALEAHGVALCHSIYGRQEENGEDR